MRPLRLTLRLQVVITHSLTRAGLDAADRLLDLSTGLV